MTERALTRLAWAGVIAAGLYLAAHAAVRWPAELLVLLPVALVVVAVVAARRRW